MRRSALQPLTPVWAHSERILGLCKSIFRVDSVLLHLRDGNTVFARPGDSMFPEALRRAACVALAPPGKEAEICEDPENDSRQASRLHRFMSAISVVD